MSRVLPCIVLVFCTPLASSFRHHGGMMRQWYGASMFRTDVHRRIYSSSSNNDYDSAVYYDQSAARNAIDQACYTTDAFWRQVDHAIPGLARAPELERFRGFVHNLQTKAPGQEVHREDGQQLLAQYEFPGLGIDDGVYRAPYPEDQYPELQALRNNLERIVAPTARRELRELLGARPLVCDDEDFEGMDQNDGDTWQRAAWYGWQFLSLRGARRWMPQTSRALVQAMRVDIPNKHSKSSSSMVCGPAHRFVGLARQKAHCRGTDHSDGRNYLLSTLTPLKVPLPEGSCGIVVNDMTAVIHRDPVLLDNTFVHHVYNNGDDDRYCLMSECYHPALTMIELEALATLFAVKDRFTVTDLALAPWGYDDESLEYALSSSDVVNDLNSWKDIGYDREAVHVVKALEQPKRTRVRRGSRSVTAKGFGS